LFIRIPRCEKFPSKFDAAGFSAKRVAMQVDMEEIIKRFKLDENSAGQVKEEVESFSDWINEYGPVTWFSGESVDELELDSTLVWTPQSGNDECISNGYEDSDYPDVLREGYFVATEPCDDEPYSVFVTTGLWIDCTSCADEGDESEDCDLCDGNACFLLDILDMFDEIQVAKQG
jgi:hypothetical protein